MRGDSRPARSAGLPQPASENTDGASSCTSSNNTPTTSRPAASRPASRSSPRTSRTDPALTGVARAGSVRSRIRHHPPGPTGSVIPLLASMMRASMSGSVCSWPRRSTLLVPW